MTTRKDRLNKFIAFLSVSRRYASEKKREGGREGRKCLCVYVCIAVKNCVIQRNSFAHLIRIHFISLNIYTLHPPSSSPTTHPLSSSNHLRRLSFAADFFFSLTLSLEDHRYFYLYWRLKRMRKLSCGRSRCSLLFILR